MSLAGDESAVASSPSRSGTIPRPDFGRQQPFYIGVAGGTASGKTTVCDAIMQRLHDQCVVMISQDSFYRGLTAAELANVKGGGCEALCMHTWLQTNRRTCRK